MNDLDDVERSAMRAVAALRGIATYLADRTGDGPASVPVALAGEGAEAVERVLVYLRSLRGAGDGAAVESPRLTPWQDWAAPSVPLSRVHRTSRGPYRGDPGE